ncbi:MAG: hypothetical protein ACLFVD_02750 [Dehalococcoidia bacterium]
MTDLRTVPRPHDTNFASVTITRLGDSRNTRYQITPDAKTSYAAIAAANTAAILAGREHEHQDR